MSDNKSKAQVTETVTLNVEPFIVPGAIVLSAMILASGLFFGLNNIATSLKGGLVVGNTATGTTPPPTTTNPTVSIDNVKALWGAQNGMKFGSADAKVLFVEFSDPSCPYCHIAGGLNPELNASAGEQFKLVADGGAYVAPVPEFKKLVDEGVAAYAWFYTNGHGNGELGTIALYCANEQGKFWEAHDLLYSAAGYDFVNETVQNDKAKSGEVAQFLSSATDSGAMKSCIDSGKYDSRIAEDSASGQALGVSGTPGFFVNETNFAGAYSYSDMETIVNQALGR